MPPISHGTELTSPLGGRVSRSDRGASSLELALLAPVLLLMSFFVVQGAMWFHARQVAQSAVEEGARAARAYNGSSADGRREAMESFDDLGGDRLVEGTPTVTVVRGSDTVTVTMVARSVQVVPIIPMPQVTARAGGPVERFVPPGAP